MANCPCLKDTLLRLADHRQTSFSELYPASLERTKQSRRNMREDQDSQNYSVKISDALLPFLQTPQQPAILSVRPLLWRVDPRELAHLSGFLSRHPAFL